MNKLLLSTLLLFLVSNCYANKVKKMDIDAPQGFSNAPIINVYSSNGEKWDRIDKTQSTVIKVGLNAECKYEGKGNKAYRGRFRVYGFEAVGDTEPSNFLIPHSKEAKGVFRYESGIGQDIKPLQACATELEKRLSQNPKKTKYHILSKGFSISYPAALTTSFSLTCKPTGWGFTDASTDTTKVNAKIHCQGSALAKEKIPKPKPKRAKLIDPLKAAKFSAFPKEFTGQCPVQIAFKGEITANYKTTVRYKYVANDGKTSPEFTLTFDKAGTKATRKWFKTVSKPDKSKTLTLGGNPGKWNVQGWYKLEILSPQQGSTIAKYKIDCMKPQPIRARIKAP